MRINRVVSFLLVVSFFLFVNGNALAKEITIPNPVGDIYVQDFANVLSETERAELRNWGREVENRTTAQIAVLTVDSIEDYSIEEFSNEAFRKYRLGSQKENNGVLLVLAMNDRKERIEVGYGLEGRLPDGKVGRILDEYTVPLLQKQQPNQAILQTYKVLTYEVLQEYGIDAKEIFGPSSPSLDQPQMSNSGNNGLGIPTWLIILIVVVLIFLDFKFFGGTLTYFILSILSRGGGRGGGGGGSRGGGGGSSGGGGASRGW
ncbi:TPM domain-containing protein [Neobacillus sp. D3-1R]|uniref:TPM domain-containing protein n=1 Tax=Neobacillus sp. D3-1R TaxID=3445778 RepID=UPI003F9F7E50